MGEKFGNPWTASPKQMLSRAETLLCATALVAWSIRRDEGSGPRSQVGAGRGVTFPS